MSKKTVIRADLIGSNCKMAILSTVAKLEAGAILVPCIDQGIKSMDIDDENCTLTVVGTVDPVAVVLKLKKACLAAAIVSVEDDKPKEPEEDDDPCHCREACVQACVEACEKGCMPGCYYSPCLLPNCCFYTPFRPAPYDYGWHW